MRTPAERRVDELASELQRLRTVPNPSKEQRARIFAIETSKLPSAWNAVHRVRQRERL